MMIINQDTKQTTVRTVESIVKEPIVMTAKQKEETRDRIEKNKLMKLEKAQAKVEKPLTTETEQATVEITTKEEPTMKRSSNLSQAAQQIVDDYHTYGCIVTVPLIEDTEAGYRIIRHAEAVEAADFLGHTTVRAFVYSPASKQTELKIVSVERIILKAAPEQEQAPAPAPEQEQAPAPAPEQDVISTILARLDAVEQRNAELTKQMQETRTQLRIQQQPAPTVEEPVMEELTVEPTKVVKHKAVRTADTTKAVKAKAPTPKVTKAMIEALNAQLKEATGKALDISKYNMKSSTARANALTAVQNALINATK